MLREGAAGRRRADIVENVKDEVLGRCMRANVVCGGNRHARLLDGNSGAIGACAIAGFRESTSPSTQIGMIRCGQTTTLFDVEENDRLRGKTLSLCARGCVSRVGSSLLRRSFVLEIASLRAAVKKQK